MNLIGDNARWRKIWRDLWENRWRTGLVVVALMIGIFAVGSVLTAYTILSREMARNFTETLPPDAVFTVHEEGKSLAEQVAQRPEVASATMRRVIGGRLATGTNRWLPLVLFVVDDFEGEMTVSRFYPESGRFRPGVGEIVLERSSLDLITSEIGDLLTVKTPNGLATSVSFVGTVHDPAQAPAWMEGLAYGYVTADTAQQLGESSSFNALQVRFVGGGLSREANRTAADQLGQELRAAGVETGGVQVPAPGVHPHADQMNALLFLLAVFGGLALLLSGSLTATMMGALMRRQLQQIGMMKSLGGTSRQILRLYMALVLMMAFLALVPALWLSLWMGWAYAGFSAETLNFTIGNWWPAGWVYGVQVGAALLIPAVSAILPIWRTSRMTIRETLQAKGGRPSPSTAAVGGAWLSRLGQNPILLFALRNTVRQPRRTLLTLSSLIMGGAIFISALNISRSWLTTIDRSFETRLFEFTLQVRERFEPEMAAALIEQIEGVEGVDVGRSAKAAVLVAGSGASRFELVALPADQTLHNFRFREGRFETAGMVISHRLAKGENLAVDDVVMVQVGEAVIAWEITGIVEELIPQAYVSLADFDSRVGAGQGVPTIWIEGGEMLSAVDDRTLQQIEAFLTREQFTVISTTAKTATYRSLVDHVDVITDFLIFSALFVAIVGSLGLMSATSLNVLERTREIGVMRSLGATSMTVLWLILSEGLALAVLSWLGAVVLALPISLVFGNIAGNIFLQIPLVLSYSVAGVFLWLGLVLLVAFVATAFPAVEATDQAVSAALAYE